MGLSDDALAIERFQQGDEKGFDALVYRYQSYALRLAFLLIGNRETAQDIAQEAFLTVYRSLGRFQLDRSFAPWLYGIVTNIARRFRAREPRTSLLSVEHLGDEQDDSLLIISPLPGPETLAEHHELQSTILQALEHVSRKQREAIVLRYYLGLSDNDIAQIVGCLPNAVRQRIFGGLRALERHLRTHAAWVQNEPDAIPGASQGKEVAQ